MPKNINISATQEPVKMVQGYQPGQCVRKCVKAKQDDVLCTMRFLISSRNAIEILVINQLPSCLKLIRQYVDRLYSNSKSEAQKYIDKSSVYRI